MGVVFLIRTEPLRFNYEFSRVFKMGSRLSGRYILLYVFERDARVCRKKKQVPHGTNRLGVTASKKVRTAVQRNRIRRLLRECYRTLEADVKTGYDLIFMLKNMDTPPSFAVLLKDMESLLKRVGAMERAAL